MRVLSNWSDWGFFELMLIPNANQIFAFASKASFYKVSITLEFLENYCSIAKIHSMHEGCFHCGYYLESLGPLG
jgi:hypothetical protein